MNTTEQQTRVFPRDMESLTKATNLRSAAKAVEQIVRSLPNTSGSLVHYGTPGEWQKGTWVVQLVKLDDEGYTIDEHWEICRSTTTKGLLGEAMAARNAIYFARTTATMPSVQVEAN